MPLVDIEALPPLGPVGRQTGRRRTGAAAAAGVMALVLSLIWAARAFWAMADPQIGRSDLQVAAVVLVASVASIVVAADLIRCRAWAQRATVACFAVWTVLSVLSMIVKNASDPVDVTWYPFQPALVGAHLLVLFFATSRSARADVGLPLLP